MILPYNYLYSKIDFFFFLFLSEKNEVEMGRSNTRVGTKRYMPPEVLSQTINVKNMEDFKQADMYSLGLVLWEMCLKTKTYKDGVEHYETYQLPYSEHVMSDPSCEEMLDIVCHKVSFLKKYFPPPVYAESNSRNLKKYLFS